MSLKVPARGAVAMLGRNGAGKTTLLKTLFGELPPMSGTIQLDGAAVEGERAEQRVRRGIGYVPQEHAIFAKLTVRENLLLGCVRQPDRSGMDYVLDFFPKLAQRLQQTAGTLSGGERKMLAIGRAVLGRPRLLMLDEPTEGVWVGVIEEIAGRLKQLSREMAVMLVEQHIELALERREPCLCHGPRACRARRQLRRDPRQPTTLPLPRPVVAWTSGRPRGSLARPATSGHCCPPGPG